MASLPGVYVDRGLGFFSSLCIKNARLARIRQPGDSSTAFAPDLEVASCYAAGHVSESLPHHKTNTGDLVGRAIGQPNDNGVAV